MTLAEQLATLPEQGQDQPRHRADAAAELRRLRAELADAIDWRDAAQEELRKCQQDAIRLQNELAALQKPAYYVTVSGRLHLTDPTALAFEMPDGRHPLYVAPVAPAAKHVGETKFEGWLSRHEPDTNPNRTGRYSKQDMRDAYWAGYSERLA